MLSYIFDANLNGYERADTGGGTNNDDPLEDKKGICQRYSGTL